MHLVIVGDSKLVDAFPYSYGSVLNSYLRSCSFVTNNAKHLLDFSLLGLNRDTNH